jgi:DNA-binding transcriptional regulator YhcF (GntR family)
MEVERMNTGVVQVPVALLRHPDQTPHTKLVWMAQQIQPDATPARVEALTGLCRHTVLKGLARITAAQWPHGGPRVKMPLALLAERSVGARAKILYGLLQTLPSFRWRRGKFSFPELSSHTGIDANTLRRAMHELSGAGWISLRQKNRLRPITFALGTPQQQRAEAEAALAARRIDRARHKGETIMHEYLSLLIDSTEFANTTKPSFLVNPETQELLELDRFYDKLMLAFEFHGDQHDRATERYTAKEVSEQHQRDLYKAGLCTYAGIHLIILRAEDLELQRLIGKLSRFAPMRNLAGHERLIEKLEEASLCYWAETQAARRAGK